MGSKCSPWAWGYAFDLYHAKKAGLGVFANNPGACRCYESVGFAENGITENYQIGEETWKCIEMELRNI